MKPFGNRLAEVPSLFEDAFGPTYLGNPDLVNGLVGEFCAKVESLVLSLLAKEISADDAKATSAAEIYRLADIFSGRDAAYKVVKGYHGASLNGKLMADLGSFWQMHRAEWNDDPVCVLFDWPAALVIEKVKLADGDDMLLEVMLKLFDPVHRRGTAWD